jgi:hypothetical protein
MAGEEVGPGKQVQWLDQKDATLTKVIVSRIIYIINIINGLGLHIRAAGNLAIVLAVENSRAGIGLSRKLKLGVLPTDVSPVTRRSQARMPN